MVFQAVFLNFFAVFALAFGKHACIQTASFDRHINKRLRCEIFKTVAAHHDVCIEMCVSTLTCFSTNTYQHENGTDACELVRGTKTSLEEKGCFERKQGAIHSSLLSSKSTSKTRKALPDGWFQLGSSGFKMFETMKDTTEAKANDLCSTNGATLALEFSDELEKKFVTELFPESVAGSILNVQKMGPEKHWKLDGSDSDVKIHGNASYQEDRDAATKILKLPGTVGSYATTPKFPISQKNFTISFWVKSSNFNKLSATVQVYSSWDARNHVFAISPKVFTARKVYHQKSTRFMVKYTSDLPKHQWVNVVGTWYKHGVNGKASLYIDGLKVNENPVHDTNHNGLGFPNPPVEVFDIGFNRETLEVMEGKVRDLLVFYRPLTAEEVKALKGALDYESKGVLICKKTI